MNNLPTFLQTISLTRLAKLLGRTTSLTKKMLDQHDIRPIFTSCHAKMVRQLYSVNEIEQKLHVSLFDERFRQ